jgi:NADPH:quinone reductase-like Zn-dependent oxidoreductase
MKAFVLEDFDAEPGLREGLPEPEPAEDQVVVRVQGSSVNPIDNAIAGGMLRQFADYRFPVVLGRDFAGVVERVADDLPGYEVGDEVLGRVQGAGAEVHAGAWAELIAVTVDPSITKKPSGVDTAAAGALAVAGLTALAAVDALDLQGGEAVLIIGAAGGVGCIAVQLAKRAGAHVIAPGLPEDELFLVDLGVDHVIPRDGDVAGVTRELEDGGVYGLIDNVSHTPEELEVYSAALVDGGIVASPLRAAGEGPNRHNVNATAEAGELAHLAGLIEEGQLRVPIQSTYTLEDAGQALTDLPGKHTQGKLAIALS